MSLTADKEFKVKKIITEVLDQSSFVEALSLVRGKSSLGEAAGEGVVSGFGMISDIRVSIFGLIHEVLLGGIGKKTAKKISHVVGSAVKIGAPIIGFIDSEGARFAEGIKALEGYAGILESFSKAYGKVPIILVICGVNYGMLSYLSTFANFCIAYPGAKIATSSPLLLASKSKKDEKDVANLKIHTKMSGIVTNTVENSSELKEKITEILNLLLLREITPNDDPNRTCKSLINGSNPREIILEAFDDKKFFELRKEFASEAITGLARLNGRTVGVIACDKNINEGRITSKAARKIIELLSICNNFDLPVINIVDCAGVINDLNQENYDLIPNVADMLYAYNMCNCAKISLISGKAIGIGYVAFANKRTFDYSVAWDGANIGMLNDVQSATLLYSDLIANAEDKDTALNHLALAYGKDNSAAKVVAESGYIDNVINPVHTRQYLIAAMEAFANKR